MQFEGSQLKCGEGCELAESLDKISCLVNGWSPALDVVSFAASHVSVYTLAFYEPVPNDKQALMIDDRLFPGELLQCVPFL